jgi:hypothetical protein
MACSKTAECPLCATAVVAVPSSAVSHSLDLDRRWQEPSPVAVETPVVHSEWLRVEEPPAADRLTDISQAILAALLDRSSSFPCRNAESTRTWRGAFSGP